MNGLSLSVSSAEKYSACGLVEGPFVCFTCRGSSCAFETACSEGLSAFGSDTTRSAPNPLEGSDPNPLEGPAGRTNPDRFWFGTRKGL